MTFTQIEYFLEAAGTKNLTKAAEKLYITQQAVSKQISSMEQELGFPLFERSNKGISLTPAGEICLKNWEKILKLHQETIQKAGEAMLEQKISLRVGISDFAGIRDYLIPVLEAFSKKYDTIECIYEVDNVVNLCYKMNQGKLDLLISFESEFEGEDYFWIPLYPLDIHVGLTVGRNHPLAGKENLTLEDVKHEKLLLLKNSYSRKAAESVLGYLKREHFQPEEIEYYENINTLELALSTGRGITIAYDVILAGIDSRLKFYPLDIPREEYLMELSVAWKHKENRGYAEKLAGLQI